MENNEADSYLWKDATKDTNPEDPKVKEVVKKISRGFLLEMVSADNRLNEDAKAVFMAIFNLILKSDESEWFTKKSIYKKAIQFRLKDKRRTDSALKNLLEVKVLKSYLLNEEVYYSLGNVFEAYPTVFNDLQNKPNAVKDILERKYSRRKRSYGRR